MNGILSTSISILVVVVLSINLSIVTAASPSSLRRNDAEDHTIADDDKKNAILILTGNGAAADATTTTTTTTTTNYDNRNLQQSCDITAAYHPDYSLPWSEGHCIFTTTCNSPSYATELACCQEAYAGQASGVCLSFMENPPTTSPTKTGGLDAWYADYSLAWPIGVCINTVPLPNHGVVIYASQLACCQGAYSDQMSKACINGLVNPPTTSPTKAGDAATDYYPDYSLAWPEGKCINSKPVPSGRPIYTSQLACCKAAYGGQVSKVCINDLPNPPTMAPTKAGGPEEYYPDYSLAWPEGICINTVPVPSGRPTYTTALGCCRAAYAGQVSRACIIAATPTPAASTPMTATPTTREPTATPTDSPTTREPTGSPMTDSPTTREPTGSPTYDPYFCPVSDPSLLIPCGPSNPCGNGWCCSPNGFCGTTAAACGPGCQNGACIAPVCAPVVGSNLDTWLGVTGKTIAELNTATNNLQDAPDAQEEVTLCTLQTPHTDNTATSYEHYGRRMWGYLVPPKTATYTFWLSADDAGEFWLSTDGAFSNKVKICQVATAKYPHEYDAEANQMSAPISLVAGQPYYYEAIMIEDGGGDHLSVAWDSDAPFNREIIPIAFSRTIYPGMPTDATYCVSD